MYVNGVSVARVNETEYSDGWMRTFRKREIPVLTDEERNFLTNYIKEEKIEETLIYLDKYRNIQGDMAEFLVRELIRGINAKQKL